MRYDSTIGADEAIDAPHRVFVSAEIAPRDVQSDESDGNAPAPPMSDENGSFDVEGLAKRILAAWVFSAMVGK